MTVTQRGLFDPPVEPSVLPQEVQKQPEPCPTTLHTAEASTARQDGEPERSSWEATIELYFGGTGYGPL